MHTLIVGMTESGKTCLAKAMARGLRRAKKRVAVLDPMYDSGWEADYKTADPAEFDAYLKENRTVYGFVDEGGETFNEGNDMSYSWWSTRSRHWGHSMVFLAQRAIQVPRTMRDQCSRLHLFTAALDDGKILASEWNKPILATCNTLPQFHFYSVSKYGICESLMIRNYKDVTRANRNNSGPRGVANSRGGGREMDSGKGTE